MSFHLFSHSPKDHHSNSPQIGGHGNHEDESLNPATDGAASPRKNASPLLAPKPVHGHHKPVDSPNRSSPRPDSPNRSDSPQSLSKYLADPFRNSPRPDHVGDYVDPMGGSMRQNSGKDPMSSGA
jgi:hypothetical protein